MHQNKECKTAIPHYTIVNKKGVVVEKSFIWSDAEQVKSKLVSLIKE